MDETRVTAPIVSVRAIVHAPAPVDSSRYASVERLGAGGMGTVDEVADRLLGRAVARKSVSDPTYAALLVAEAQVCAQLEHPSIVPVYDLFSDPTLGPVYTMRIVRGRTLRDLIRAEDRVRSRHRLLGILRQVCFAVDYAHSRGVVHRDLKPANIVIGEFGEVYVLDWGLAVVLADSDVRRDVTAPVSGGSPGYMAPEQLDDTGTLSAATDLFAIGVILYEILCGSRPFPVMGSVLLPLEKRPRQIEASAPAELDDLAVRCLSHDASDRPPSARAVADALDAFFSGEQEREAQYNAANEAANEGDVARADHERFRAESARLLESSRALLAAIPSWESMAAKQPAWDMLATSRRFASEASDAFARASAAYTRALGQVRDDVRARAGLAKLHLVELDRAEHDGHSELARQHLALARAYDDGALPLADGRLVVTTDVEGARITVARYETVGVLLRPGGEIPVGTRGVALPAGSYVVTVEWGRNRVRAPVLIGRVKTVTLRLAVRVAEDLPAGMILIPGGPFLARRTHRAGHEPRLLSDFCLAEFPVTIGDYSMMLDEFPERVPRNAGRPELFKGLHGWEVDPSLVEGAGARARVPDPLKLPVASVTWFDAAAFARWAAAKSGIPYRLPTLLELDKATHGVDGRPFPMGVTLDPAFAKLRESRPEASQIEPIGAFPLDESPYGVRDMTGGVTSWTSTFVDGRAAPSAEQESNAETCERRAFHLGGSWSYTAYAERLSWAEQRVTTRGGWIGFRLAMDVKGFASTVEIMS